MIEEPITFKNKKGEKLFGIVHIPENPLLSEKRMGVNLLNPGVKYRVAPHRLNVKLARRLCQKGYYVLRFDPSGIGDSEGELNGNVLVHDIWGNIQAGLFIKDTITANDFFIGNYHLDKLILVGNCGGAITSLLASAEDPSINALCLADPPVYLWSSNKSFSDTIAGRGEKADWYFSEYVMKMMNLNSWYRLFTLKTNYKALWKVILVKLQKQLKSSQRNVKLSENLETLCKEKKLNRLFFKSYEAFVQGNKPILFVLAGNDPGFDTFQNYFQNYYLKNRLEKVGHDNLTEVFVIQESNHIYTGKEWQESLINEVSRWIDNHF